MTWSPLRRNNQPQDGVPARVAVGFASGQYDKQLQAYRVRDDCILPRIVRAGSMWVFADMIDIAARHTE